MKPCNSLFYDFKCNYPLSKNKRLQIMANRRNSSVSCNETAFNKFTLVMALLKIMGIPQQ